MTIPFKSETRHCEDWNVTIYKTPDSSGFYAKCVSPSGEVLSTEIFEKKGSVWQEAYKLVEQVVREQRTHRYNKIVIPLTLSLLYVTGQDNFYEGLTGQLKFSSRSAKNCYDSEILNILENQGLIEKPRDTRRNNTVYLTNEGIKHARKLLRDLNLEVDEFLQAYAKHENLPEKSKYGDKPLIDDKK